MSMNRTSDTNHKKIKKSSADNLLKSRLLTGFCHCPEQAGESSFPNSISMLDLPHRRCFAHGESGSFPSASPVRHLRS
jgi:hypothetical protein